MPAFHDVSFPLGLAFGAVGGPERRTEIVTLASGKEQRNSPWALSRRRWDAGPGVKSLDDLAVLTAFFEARRGPLHAFRFRDPFDHASAAPSANISPLDQPLGAGDGATNQFQLVKRYDSGAYGVDRPIGKPVADSVRVAVDGAELSEGVDFSIDAVMGVVSFTVPPTNGAVLTAGFLFDTPARFDADRLELSLAAFQVGEAPSAPLVEVLV